MVLLLKSACLMTTPASAWVAYASEWFWLTITFLFPFGGYSQEANVPTALRPTLSPRHFNSLVLTDHVILTSAFQNILVLSFPSHGRQDSVTWWSPLLREARWTLRCSIFQKRPKLVQTSFSIQISADVTRILFLLLFHWELPYPGECSPLVKMNPQNVSFKFYFRDDILVMELSKS